MDELRSDNIAYNGKATALPTTLGNQKKIFAPWNFLKPFRRNKGLA